MKQYRHGSNYGRHQPRPRFDRTVMAPIVVAALLLAVLMRIVFDGTGLPLAGGGPADPRPVADRGDYGTEEQATINLFERCSQSVVYVSPVIARLRQSFFGYERSYEQGTGSGFVWDKNGHIVTNYHVVAGAAAIAVTLPDNTTYEATKVGEYPDKDVTVLRIDAPREKLIPIDIGTSKDLRVGQKVFAIGNPFGLDFTLTTGVVSALNRQLNAANTKRTIEGVIQTDAAINPGNSGGPLLDSAGRLIGMNTAIYTRTGDSAGIGFAVPVDAINRVVPQLIAHGKVIRPGLGIGPATDYDARRLRLDGVLVLHVLDGSSAAEAGIRPTLRDRTGRIILGDIILKVGDRRTEDNDSLFNALEKYEVGDTVELTILRDNEEIKVDVTLQAIG